MANRRDLLSDSVATSERLSTGCEEAGIVLKVASSMELLSTPANFVEASET